MLVPSAAPSTAPPESASNAWRSRGTEPSGRINPARCVTAIRVPALSSTSTRKKVSTTVTTPKDSAPATSICKKVGASEGGGATTPRNSVSPSGTPARAAASTPISTAPGTRRAANPAINKKAAQDSSVPGWDRSPRATSVAGLAATKPMPRNPIRPRNNPIPAAMPSLSDSGTAAINHSRTRSRETSKNNNPDRNTAPSAVRHGTPMAPTTVKVK